MAEEDAKAKSGGKGKLIIIVLLVLVLLGGAGGAAAWFLLRPKPQPTPAQLAAAREKDMRFITMEPFVTNVQSSDGSTHYLQVRIDLKTYDPKAEEAVKRMTPELRNAILRILAAQSADTLATVATRDQLRGEILAAVNKLVAEPNANAAPGAAVAGHAAQGKVEGPISGVYFTAFVVQ